MQERIEAMDAIERKCLDNQRAKVTMALAVYEGENAKLVALEKAFSGAVTAAGLAATVPPKNPSTIGAKKKAAKRQASRRESAAPVVALISSRKKAAQGSRPSLAKAIQKVIGKRWLTRDAVIAALGGRGWLPESKNMKAYIGQTLSQLANGGGPLVSRRDVHGTAYTCGAEH